jgi:hypothetical protein
MYGIWHPYSLERTMKRFRRIASLTLVPVMLAVCLVLPAASRSEAAASGLTLAESCTADGIASLSFGWQGTGAAASELWLDVGPDNAWRPGGFASAGPLIPGTRSYEWPGFTAGLTYYVRVSELRWDQSWDISQTASFTTFACNRSAAGSPSTTTGAGASAKPTASATGSVSDNATDGSVSATGNGPAINNLSSTAYVAASGGSSSTDAPPADAVARPQALPLNPNTRVVAPTVYYVPPTIYYMPSVTSITSGTNYIPFAGNGGGPTLCSDGMTSHSSSSGTCSSHGGEALQ